MEAVAQASCAWLTTLRVDGSPHTTRVWFVLLDNTFWVASGASNVKVRNLGADARVSVAIDGSAESPHVAQGQGFVRKDLEQFSDVVTAFAAKYDGWDVADPSQDGRRVLIEIPIDRWLLH
jgi:hypothetical protein